MLLLFIIMTLVHFANYYTGKYSFEAVCGSYLFLVLSLGVSLFILSKVQSKFYTLLSKLLGANENTLQFSLISYVIVLLLCFGMSRYLLIHYTEYVPLLFNK